MRFLTPSDVARLAGVDSDAVRNWDRMGRLQPVARTARGARLYDLHQVETFLARRAKGHRRERATAGR
jgi:DNA-binding transcriptional MerR regulator